MEKPTKALILAAGLGTRLKPLTDFYSKPSLPICGVPTIWFPIWHFYSLLKLKDIAVNVSYLPDTLKKVLDDSVLHKEMPVCFQFSDETSELLGSSGALWKLKSWIGNDRIFVANADTICFPDLKKMLAFHLEKKAAITIHVKEFESTSEELYRHIQLDRKGLVEELADKRRVGTAFSGIYIIEPEALALLPDGKSETVPTLFEPLIKERRLYAYRENIPWMDTGTVENYFKSHFSLMNTFPHLRYLIELKMVELRPGLWLEKKYKSYDPKKLSGIISPAIMYGDPDISLKNISKIGPDFLGLEIDKDIRIKDSAKKLLVFRDFVKHFD